MNLTNSPTAFLELQGVSYTYPGWPAVVKNVQWQVWPGEFHCLIGRSGCGKTTLLKLAAGLLQPQAGQVLLNGQAVTRPNKRVGFVFQTPTLLEWLTVLDNVLLPATLRRTSDPTYRTRAFDLLHAVGLSAYAHQYPHQLSGGQQSRVALARALILEPLMLLLDEPFAALDAMTREELQSLLLHVCDNHQVTVMFVTHDIAEAVFLADRVAVMAEGQLLENFEIAIPKPRRLCMRYSHEFNRLCESLRLTMDGSP